MAPARDGCSIPMDLTGPPVRETAEPPPDRQPGAAYAAPPAEASCSASERVSATNALRMPLINSSPVEPGLGGRWDAR